MITPLVLGVLLGVRQTPTVSLELRGVRVENALPQIAQTFGWSNLQVVPQLKNEVLLVRANNVDPLVLRKKIEEALHGQFETRNGQIWLSQSDIQKAEEKKTYDAQRYKFFREMTEKAQKRIAALKPMNEETCKEIVKDLKAISKMTVSRQNQGIWKKINEVDNQSPINRFAMRAIQRLKPEAWMKLSDEHPRAVFCNRPNSMQLPMPMQIDDLLQQLVQDQNTWSTYGGGEPLQGPRANDQGYESYYWLGNMNQQRQPFRADDIYTITLSLDLREQDVEFDIYNKKGTRISQQQLNFYDAGDWNESDYRDEIERIKKKFVKLQGDAGEYLDLVAPVEAYSVNYNGQPKHKPISPSLLEKLTHPENIDPLSIAAPEVFLSSIATPNVVMVMNDNQRQARFAEFKGSRFATFEAGSMSDDGTWFIYHHANPIEMRKQMPERQRLGPILRFISKNHRPLNLEEQADLTYHLPWTNEAQWTYRSHMAPLVDNEVDNYNNQSGLRIYGSMNAGEREQAKKNGIAVGAMSDSLKLELYRAIFQSRKYDSQVSMDYESLYGNGRQPSQKEQQAFNELQSLLYGGIYEEKTFLMPDGLLNNMVLKITDMSSDTLYAGRPPVEEGQPYYGGGRVISPNELGGMLFRQTNPTRYRYETEGWNRIDENNIRLASHRSMMLEIRLGQAMRLQWNLNQTLYTDPAVYNSKNLPQKILDEIQKGYKQAQEQDKQYGNQGVVFGGPPARTNPPPPR